MTDENKKYPINIEDVWWIYIYLVPNFLTNDGKIISTILEYGGIINSKKELYKKVKENSIDISYPTFVESIKRLMINNFLIRTIINKKVYLVINNVHLEKTKEYKERILTKLE